MTNPSGLQSQSFVPNPMPDVIDSLKRLERLGSDASKATEKMLHAAAQIEQAIVAAFVALADRAEIPIAGKMIDNQRVVYKINNGQLLRWVGNSGTRVSISRNAALGFAEDIAEGLLDHVREILQKRLEQVQKAGETLEGALSLVSKPPFK